MGMNPAMARAIAQADTMGGGNWPRDGRYVWAVERIWQKLPREMGGTGFKGHSFIMNFYVVEASQVDPQVQPNAVGSTVSYSINLSSNPVAKQLVKTAICGILGEEVATDPAAKQKQDQEIEALLVGYPDPRTGRQVPSVLDPEQPLRGYLVAVEAWTGRTVGKGTPITKYSFKSIKMSDQDKAIWRARLDKEKPLEGGGQQTMQYGQQPVQAPQYGQQPVQAPQYGQQPVQAPQYGQQPVQAPQYGQPPAQPPQFGQQPAQPPQFGQQPVQAPQYGQPPAQPPQFGQPAFGQPAFGQPPVQPAFAPQGAPPAQPQFGQPRWPQ